MDDDLWRYLDYDDENEDSADSWPDLPQRQANFAQLDQLLGSLRALVGEDIDGTAIANDSFRAELRLIISSKGKPNLRLTIIPLVEMEESFVLDQHTIQAFPEKSLYDRVPGLAQAEPDCTAHFELVTSEETDQWQAEWPLDPFFALGSDCCTIAFHVDDLPTAPVQPVNYDNNPLRWAHLTHFSDDAKVEDFERLNPHFGKG